MCSHLSYIAPVGIGVALIVIGALGLYSVIGDYAFGWTTFGLTLPTGFIILPILSVLSAYGIVATTGVAGFAISTGALFLMIGSCMFHLRKCLPK